MDKYPVKALLFVRVNIQPEIARNAQKRMEILSKSPFLYGLNDKN